jgi:hypothetical protein
MDRHSADVQGSRQVDTYLICRLAVDEDDFTTGAVVSVRTSKRSKEEEQSGPPYGHQAKVPRYMSMVLSPSYTNITSRYYCEISRIRSMIIGNHLGRATLMGEQKPTRPFA